MASDDSTTTDPVADLFEEGEESSAPLEEPPLDHADPNRLTTGIDTLDRHLQGGIPPGRLLTIVAPADTQSELLVKQLAACHDCLYLSTLRPKWEVEEEVADHVQTATRGEGSVHIEQLNPDGRLDDARRYVEEIEDSSIVVIDSVNELEALEQPRYVRFIDDVKELLWETGSVGVFYGVEEADPPPGRTVTLRRTDLIWQLRRTVSAGEVEHLLVVSKFRGGKALAKPVKLELTDRVGIDTSRDIA